MKTDMTEMKQKVRFVAKVLGKKYPNPKTELVAESAFQLLISTMLAAQCTDRRVNIVTMIFFNKYPTVETMAILSIDEIKAYIKSINFFNNKAKNIHGVCRAILNDYQGKVPDTLEGLTALPGVGRKTAHVVLSNCFGMPVMAVDTHVFRVANRIGLAHGKTPLEVERQLTAVIPKKLIHDFHHYLILHGRYVCKAKNPSCQICPVQRACEFYSRDCYSKEMKK